MEPIDIDVSQSTNINSLEISSSSEPLISPATAVTIQEPSKTNRSIILFDGVCNVCHGFVAFIYPRDKKKKFHFQALQSAKGREILSQWGIPCDLNTIILIDEVEGKHYIKSTAVFKILYDLDLPWAYLYYLIFIPRFVRDFGYSSFASVRYAIFGTKEECQFFPGLRERFIDWRSPIITDTLEGAKDV